MKELTRKKYIILLLTIVLFMTIGFAVLSSSVTINGTSTINSNTWNVKFQNIQLDSLNNVTATTTPSITDNTSISFSVVLSSPGDKYSFTVDVVNTGSIDAMINSINKSTLTTTQSKYLDYTVTYSDGVAINQKDKLVKTNGSETIKISINFKTDISAGDLPSSADTLNLTFSLNYVQADSTAQDITHTALHNFILKAKAGNATSTDVGTTFTVDLGDDYGEHTLRVANISTTSECSNEGFSQTACGVVLEFADIITSYDINGTNTNVGGWPATMMRTFVNTEIYNALPCNLRNAIINTTVVSGYYYPSGDSNYISTDKLYLLSAHEVWVDGASNHVSDRDTSYNNTRQLDYYAEKNVTTTSYSAAMKQYDVWYTYWGLRSATMSEDRFLSVDEYGNWSFGFTHMSDGVSPAFRIA